MPTRREFVESVLAGAATLAVAGPLASSRVLGANDRIRVGLIGAGGRGQEIFKTALKCPTPRQPRWPMSISAASTR